MAADPKKRQKRLERRSAKRKEKKHLQVREQTAGLPHRLAAAVPYPVLHCWIGDDIEKQGIGWVVLSRESPNGVVAVVSFLVDSYCLGVKEAHGEVMNRSSYDAKYFRRMRADMPMRLVPPAEARKLLEEAVAYAHGIGLSPHPDYARMMLLFGSVNAAESDAKFEFGKDGMPFFVAGPRDAPERCRRIVAALNESCGPGRFHYLIPLAAGSGAAAPDAVTLRMPGLVGPDEDTDHE